MERGLESCWHNQADPPDWAGTRHEPHQSRIFGRGRKGQKSSRVTQTAATTHADSSRVCLPAGRSIARMPPRARAPGLNLVFSPSSPQPVCPWHATPTKKTFPAIQQSSAAQHNGAHHDDAQGSAPWPSCPRQVCPSTHRRSAQVELPMTLTSGLPASWRDACSSPPASRWAPNNQSSYPAIRPS